MDLETLQRLYSEQEQKNTKGLPVEEVLAMQALAERLSEINLDKIIERKLNKKPEMSKAREAKLEMKIKRTLKPKKPGRPKLHWRTKEARRKKYRVEVARPRRLKMESEQWQTGEGWFAYMSKQWRQNKYPVELTLDQWLEHVYPKCKDRVFTVQRYIKKKPIRLDNIIVMASEDRTVLFDGKEFTLEQAGLCLPALAN